MTHHSHHILLVRTYHEAYPRRTRRELRHHQLLRDWQGLIAEEYVRCEELSPALETTICHKWYEEGGENLGGIGKDPMIELTLNFSGVNFL